MYIETILKHSPGHFPEELHQKKLKWVAKSKQKKRVWKSKPESTELWEGPACLIYDKTKPKAKRVKLDDWSSESDLSDDEQMANQPEEMEDELGFGNDEDLGIQHEDGD